MCRAETDPCGGRRCTRSGGQTQMGRIMQMFNRHTRSMLSAEKAGDQARFEHYQQLLSEQGDKEDVLRASEQRYATGQSWADRFTPETTKQMSVQQMRELANSNAGDVQMYDQLNTLIARREGQPDPEPSKRPTMPTGMPGPHQHDPKPATRAGEFTIESTRDMSEDRLRIILATEATTDPPMQQAISDVLAHRREHDAQLRDAIERGEADEKAWERSFSWRTSADPTDRPSRSPRRRLSAEQQVREEYTLYAHSQFLQAENDCNGVLLNARGRAAGVDPASLFSGPAHVAHAYASDELKTWFRSNGRATLASFRYSMLGRDSDYKAAQYNRTYSGFDNAA